MKTRLFRSNTAIILVVALTIMQIANAQNTAPFWSLKGNSNAVAGSKLGTTNAIPLRLFTNNLVRVHIAPGGNVGIGTTAPTYKLHVVGGANGIFGSGTTYGVRGSGGSYGVYGSGTYGTYGSGTSYGMVGIGGTYGGYGSGSTYGLYGNGNTYGVFGSGSYGIYGSGSSYGVYGISTNNYGVYGLSGYLGTYGEGGSYGVYGYSNNNGYGVAGTSGYIGVYGSGTSYGLYGFSGNGWGVYGESTNSIGGRFYSATNYGLWAATGRTDNNWAGVFDGDVYCYNAYETSDKILKKNIKDAGDAMSIINKLKPRNYEFATEGKFAKMNLPKGTHYGLIAQEVEEVLPNIVKASVHPLDPGAMANIVKLSADGKPNPADKSQNLRRPNEKEETISLKAVNYTELIPLLIKALQEQDAKIEALTEQVSKLSQDRLISSDIKKGNDLKTGSFLGQNIPNPTSNTATIRYTLPAGSLKAQLVINDNNGKMLRQIDLGKTGNGMINIETSAFSTGTYSYSLFVNGKLLDTRKMVIVK